MALVAMGTSPNQVAKLWEDRAEFADQGVAIDLVR